MLWGIFCNSDKVIVNFVILLLFSHCQKSVLMLYDDTALFKPIYPVHDAPTAPDCVRTVRETSGPFSHRGKTGACKSICMCCHRRASSLGSARQRIFDFVVFAVLVATVMIQNRHLTHQLCVINC